MKELEQAVAALEAREGELVEELEKVRLATGQLRALLGGPVEPTRSAKSAPAGKAAAAGATCYAADRGRGRCSGELTVHPCKSACGWSIASCEAHGGKALGGTISGHGRGHAGKRAAKTARPAARGDDATEDDEPETELELEEGDDVEQLDTTDEPAVVLAAPPGAPPIVNVRDRLRHNRLMRAPRIDDADRAILRCTLKGCRAKVLDKHASKHLWDVHRLAVDSRRAAESFKIVRPARAAAA